MEELIQRLRAAQLQQAGNYYCDNCRQTITRYRYRCLGPCHNYDLCLACHLSSNGPWRGGHVKEHREALFDEAGDRLSRFGCDNCQVTIVGQRYHCQVCEDYDLCDTCWHSNGPWAGRHDASHDVSWYFEPRSKMGSFMCDSCGGEIHDGVRWHCVEPACRPRSFDLCLSCKRNGRTANHNPNHLMRGYKDPGGIRVPNMEERVVVAQAAQPAPRPAAPLAAQAPAQAPAAHQRDGPSEHTVNLECSVCMDNRSDQICVPCGHAFCEGCITRMRSCAKCRTNIQTSIKAYF